MVNNMPKNKQSSNIRSSAAEYLTFMAASGESGVEAIYADESVWLSQKMKGELYNVNVRTVSEHLRNIYNDSELEEEAVIRNFRITATDGKNYNTKHYNLKAIVAVGYNVLCSFANGLPILFLNTPLKPILGSVLRLSASLLMSKKSKALIFIRKIWLC